VLFPLLFIVMSEVAMALADKENLGIAVTGSRISNLRFSDDLAIVADGQIELQKEVSQFHETR